MCGIAGYLLREGHGQRRPDLESALRKMAHRGPDDRGTERIHGHWGELGLGHTRLSIIDLSAGGHQPMRARDGKAAIVFNGEIYNYRELRTELEQRGRSFVSESDTEVLLQAWTEWGTACLKRLVGMFAFAVADLDAGTVTFARDAFGIKPLFFARTGGGFVFASELPACVSLRAEGAAPNLQRSFDYLVHGDYDSDENTFVEGVNQVAPGTLQVVDLHSGQVSEPQRWWAPDVREAGPRRFEDAADELRQRFLDNVRLHLRSDVPLGAALSGGIDSSAVVYAMRLLEPDAPLNTFSFVARGSTVSEERWIDIANAGVKANSHRVVVQPGDLARDLDDMIVAQGEPFGSTSIYAQYRVFQLAREAGVTVTLDGQGADELLGGYLGYPGQRVQSLLDDGRIVAAFSFLRHWTRWPGRSMSDGIRASLAQYAGRGYVDRLRQALGRNPRLAWIDIEQLKQRGVRLAFPRQFPHPWPRGRRMSAELALSATRRGLPALLRHADRNSMRFHVESRVPFLTTELAEFLLSLPESFLVSPLGETKSIFRAAMRGIVPDAILDRRDKIGFATPEQDWLKTLASSARAWLHGADQIDFLHPGPMLEQFEAMLAGRVPFSWQAWRWINFCRWYVTVLRPLQSETSLRAAR